MKDGYTVFDIGIDPKRFERSKFYETEVQLLDNFSYPSTKIETLSYDVLSRVGVDVVNSSQPWPRGEEIINDINDFRLNRTPNINYSNRDIVE